MSLRQRAPFDFGPLANLRDLGGIPVRGGTVRHGTVFRADDVSTASVADAERLREQGLGTVIDLRSVDEVAHTGRGALDHDDIEYHHIPLSVEIAAPLGPDEGLRALRAPRAVGEWYASLLRAEADRIVHGLRVVADTRGAVLFHCAAGKDRTGIFAASLLGSLGASRDDIIADYALTDVVMSAVHTRLNLFFTSLLGEDHERWDPATAGAIMWAPAESMATMIEALELNAGGIRAVLAGAGLDRELEDALHDRVTAPAR